jgi:hypothetical protein
MKIMMRSLFLSRQYGVRESKDVTIEGRVQFDLLQVVIYFCLTIKSVFFVFMRLFHMFLYLHYLDMMQAMQRDYKLSSYSLNSVSAHFLGEQVSYFKCSLLLSVIVLIIILLRFCLNYLFFCVLSVLVLASDKRLCCGSYCCCWCWLYISDCMACLQSSRKLMFFCKITYVDGFICIHIIFILFTNNDLF